MASTAKGRRPEPIEDIHTVRPTPFLPIQRNLEWSRSRGVKVSTPDIIEYKDDTLPVDYLTDLLFEDIGGEEILSVSRTDLVNGQNVIYSPIKNLSDIGISYNPLSMFILPDNSEDTFQNPPIRIEEHIPDVGTGPNNEIVYFDTDTGDLVFNVVNMLSSQTVAIEVLKSGTQEGNTVY